jgi:hypothetical protein
VTRSAFVLLAGAAIALSAAGSAAALVSVSGHWRVQIGTGSEFYSGVMVLNQVGQTVIGRAGKSSITGTMVSDTKCDATWNGPKGAGWMTFNFGPSGESFNAEWGYNGRKSDGNFVGKRIPQT